MFRVAQIPALVVARGRDDNDVTTWTGARARAELLGWLELVAGEEGIGWNARLAMIRASQRRISTRAG